MACVVTCIDKEKGRPPSLAESFWDILLNCSPPFTRVLRAEQTQRDRQQALKKLTDSHWLCDSPGWLWQGAFKSPPQALWWNWVSKTFGICISWTPRLSQRYVYLWGWRCVGLSNPFQIFWDDYQSYRGNLPLWEDLKWLAQWLRQLKLMLKCPWWRHKCEQSFTGSQTNTGWHFSRGHGARGGRQ